MEKDSHKINRYFLYGKKSKVVTYCAILWISKSIQERKWYGKTARKKKKKNYQLTEACKMLFWITIIKNVPG